jgi:hypothetical protein
MALKLGLSFVCLAAFAAATSACVVETSTRPPDTRIRFEETTNLGYYCGGPLSEWQVYNRETQEQGTARCEQPIDFASLDAYTSYTFDITGWSNGQQCWQGSCVVSTGGRGSLTFADCSALITHECGY